MAKVAFPEIPLSKAVEQDWQGGDDEDAKASSETP